MSVQKYDYLIVGSGLFGSVFAYEMNRIGKKCLVIEKRDHIGGNCYTEKRDNINIHKYGAHIFHTNDEGVWNWINQFSRFNNYQHRLKVNFKNQIFSFPLNLLTFSQLWNTNTPELAKQKINSLKVHNTNPTNLEEWILSEVGEEVYNIFIKGYTTKQWNKNPIELPSSIIKRLPIRFDFNDNYFNDSFQGIPVDGYTSIFENMLKNIEVKLNTDYFSERQYYDSIASKIVYTGKIDEFFDYEFGELDYRSLEFNHELKDIPDYQGCSVVNYTDLDTPYTRIIEHKHFENSKTDKTWITKEFPKDYKKNDIPYYPINDIKNNSIFQKYKDKSRGISNVIFGGRLAEYRYYDMHQIIASALTKVKLEKYQ